MAPRLLTALIAAILTLVVSATPGHGSAMLQAWSGMLEQDSAGGKDTPVTRVVGLLKKMGQTVKAEMDEDEDLFRKLQCWCNDNSWEKGNAVEAAQAKIAELESTIEQLTASTAQLRTSIKELNAQVAEDKAALAEATAIREKQLSQFHGNEKDAIQNIESLKAALVVLAKHHSAPPDSTVAGGAIFKSERDSWSSMVQVHKGGASFPWDERVKGERSFDDFMRTSGFDETPAAEVPQAAPAKKAKFLQQQGAVQAASEESWSAEDAAIVKLAVKSASAFVQSHHEESYYPAYNSHSGEIVGVLQQLKEEMEGDLSESQKRENERAANFAELRAAKQAEISTGHASAEAKEDQLANDANALAEGKEDLEKEEASLSADQKFLANLKTTCAEADKNHEARKGARMNELTAISETIAILQGDQARDAMSGTFSSFTQVASHKVSQRAFNEKKHRQEAAQALRRAATAANDPALSILATSVELDAFTRVKKAIDDMVAMLKTQQADEVQKIDWCKSELQGNDMNDARTNTRREELEATIGTLESSIKMLESEIFDAKTNIAHTQLNLQKASVERKTGNHDFQKVVADQTTTIEVLHQALDKLATFYDLVQTKSSGTGSSWIQRQTPPVPQMEYKKSQASTGVMEMVEKLINDARDLMTSSKTSESEAQAAYEQLVADSNASVKALQGEVVAKTQSKVGAHKDLRAASSDLADTVRELEGLAKYNAELHAECDYVLKNFDTRQQARAQEIEALQQAKQILSGASLS